ncbi:MAG: 16S rRNA (guanine(527)-N(7))-methyltransferase RsmG [Alphaproteobacteria bacterium]|nr:16S rRNA (guanine(527)-N(7))-methyltransferase RsmG [Alphaproteobacteria bacterium]
MDIEKEFLQYGVSRETFNKTEQFAELLREWNQKMNLVSHNSLDLLWERHILDSVQLIDYIPVQTKRILDIGSGAGFPALVLAILLQERSPETEIIMVESIHKKTVYLKDVCNKLGLSNVKIANCRVEEGDFPKPDVITARAVASLDILCGYVYKIGGSNVESLFLKGKSYKEEVSVACKQWLFDTKVIPNKYSDEGVILKLSKLRKKQK